MSMYMSSSSLMVSAGTAQSRGGRNSSPRHLLNQRRLQVIPRYHFKPLLAPQSGMLGCPPEI